MPGVPDAKPGPSEDKFKPGPPPQVAASMEDQHPPLLLDGETEEEGRFWMKLTYIILISLSCVTVVLGAGVIIYLKLFYFRGESYVLR